ncbi:MAG: hypothetical protein B6244_06640 [Candidatus Cloacimonetes bacterium 4572_55]|nr:MAG: hypothetical protein B6244_06640 [Candidatus Cloacimonetes bacterium 4572_55]
MKNRFNGTYILIMITIILLSFVYFYEIRGKDEREKEKESADRFLIFEPDSVMFIELESNKSHVVIERTSPGKWKLTHPVEAPGDSKAIRSLLESVTTTKIIRTLSANENGNLARNKEFDLSEFGLDHPKIFLDITLSDQQSYELSFGESNPSQTAIYALKSLSPDIFLLPETFFKEVNKKAFQLRDRSVLLFQAADATGFSIHLSDVKYSCYNIIGQWQLTSPFRARAKHDQVKNFLEDLKNAQIKVFVEEEADDLSLYGLDDPEQTITVSLRDRERPIVLQIGDQVDGKEHVYAKDSTRPMVFKIDAELIRERLNIPVDQIEDKRLLNFFSYHIGHILLTLRAGKFEFNKPEYLDWRMSQPDSIRADNGRVDSLLTTLRRA